MGRNISDFNGTVIAPGGSYSYGNVKDAPSGTIVDSTMTADVIQTFMRAADLAGITYSGDPDNDANGYQYSEALGLEAWQSGPTLTFAAVGGGSISAGTVVYNKYKLVGKTLYWQVRLANATIGSGPLLIVVNSPITAGGVNFPNDAMRFCGVYNGETKLVVELNGPTGDAQISLRVSGGVAFTNGTTDQDIDFSIVAEVA